MATTPNATQAALSQLIDNNGMDAVGEVQATPTDYTVLGRLKDIADGLGDGVDSVADGANVVEGAIADAAVITNAPGTLSAKLRGLIVLFVNFLSRLPAALGAGGGLKVDGSGTALPVSGTVAATKADGSDVTLGANADTAVDGDLAGTINGHLRGIAKKLAASIAVTGTFWQATQPISGSVGVLSVTPPTTPYCGQKTCAVLATAEALAASTPLKFGATVQGLPTNTGTVSIRTSAGGSDSVILYGGDAIFMLIDDLAKIFIKVSVNGEGVGYVAS